MFKPPSIATTGPTELYYLIFFNETSKQGSLQYDIISFNILENTQFSLLIPERTCAQGHTLTLYIYRDISLIKKVKELPLPQNVSDVIELNCKVKSYDRASRGFAEITLEPQGNHQKVWSEIICESEKKQEAISELFDKYKS